MQTVPVKPLPVDPTPPNTRRDTTERGFADLLHDDKSVGQTDHRQDSPAGAERATSAAKKTTKPGTEKTDATDRPKDTDSKRKAGHKTAKTESDTGSGAADGASSADDSKDTTTVPNVLQTVPMPPQKPAGAGSDALHAAGKNAAESDPPQVDGAKASPTKGAHTPMPESKDAFPAKSDATAGKDTASDASKTDGSKSGASKSNGAKTDGAKTDGKSGESGSEAASGNTPAAVQPAAVAASPAASGTAETASTAAASTVVASAVPRQAGETRHKAGTPASADAVSLSASGDTTGKTESGDKAHQPASHDGKGQAASAPGQHKTPDGNAGTTAPSQASATAQAGGIQAGGRDTGSPAISSAGKAIAQHVADIPQGGHTPAHNQHASPPSSFANELRFASASTPAPNTAAGRAAPGPVVDQVAIQISRAVSDGLDKLTLDLKPAALGRVSVSLQLSHDHHVTAVISADRPDTLDLLQRDARGLQRALQDAGLKADSGSLSFSLNGDGAKGSPFNESSPTPTHFVAAHPAADDGDVPPVAYNPYSRPVNVTGVDIHV